MQIGDMVQTIKANGYIETGIIIKGPYLHGAFSPHSDLFGTESNKFCTVLWTNGQMAMIQKNKIEVISKCTA